MKDPAGGIPCSITAQITGLNIYPVKSMKAIPLENARLTHKGLANDRRWMVVRSDGRFVTQRELPRLALVRPALEEEGLVLAAKGHGSITVPYESPGGERIRTKVWRDDCETEDEGNAVSRWLTAALDYEPGLRLVKMAGSFVRSLHASDKLGAQTTTRFADAAPFLVTNEGSLDRLNGKLEASGFDSVPMNRFRPNIVIQGLDAFAEHGVAELSAERYGLKLCYPSERCVVTTIDQETANKDPLWQPFKALQSINPAPGNERMPAFGENAVLTHGDGCRIAVGDVLAVTTTDRPTIG